VKQGDTLTKIANQYRVSASSIAALNHITNPDLLAEGRSLRIPPAPPLRLTITPHRGTQGAAFQLTLTGAPPGAPVMFEVHGPSGTYTGPQHIASAAGTVSASYQTGQGDATGTYIVVAKGNAGPMSNSTFIVAASTPVT
jgi:LysM repeat protein